MIKQKYQVLVADDEYWIREKFRSIIKWEEYGLEFMEPVENGEEVLKCCQENTPDILITDINMPFINGVDLIRQIQEKYPEIICFVVSGYDDFEYVKDSLMAGAINYLLKPVSKIDLVAALSAALEKIGKREKDLEQILKTSALIQDREMSLLVEKEPVLFAPTMIVTGSMENAGYSMMLIKIHNLAAIMEANHYDMNAISYHIKSRIRELAGNEKLLVFNYIFRSNEFIIVTNLEVESQQHLATQIIAEAKNKWDSIVTIAVSEHAYTMDSLNEAYLQSVSVLMTRPYCRESVVIFYNKEKEKTGKNVDSPMTSEHEMRIKSLIKNGNERALQSLVGEEIGLARIEQEKWEYLKVRQTVKRICNIFMEAAQQQNENQENNFDLVLELEHMAEITDRSVEKMDMDRLLELLEEFVRIVLSQQKKSDSGSTREIMQQAVNFVDQYYYEELSLSALSEKFGIDSSYFSKMFKAQTGENLMLYIAHKRIERAKQLMKQGNTNLTEIAYLVGYDDYTYFNRVFRKCEGMSPRDFQKSASDVS